MVTHRRGPHRTIPGSLGVSRHGLIPLVSLILFVISGLPGAATAQEPERAGAVFVVSIDGTIDLGLAPFLTRVLDEAAASEAAAVILDIDTPGGRLDAVLQMRDALLASPVRTIAYVNRTAFSAGALIAIAAEEISMTPGAVMGAATPVDGATGETASAKIISAVRKTFKTTAEARGRDPLVAEAMVDPDVAIDGLVARGELLTLTTSEATRWGYADGVAADLTALLAASGLSGAPIVERSPSLAEQTVRFITDPIVASLLIILALLLIVVDFFVEGFGVAGMGGLGLLALFFWGHVLAGLAGWEDVALVLLGLILIAIEIVVIPGFGVPGILGLAALIGGLFLAMLGREIRTPDGIERAALTVAASIVVTLAGVVAALALLPRSPRVSGLVLQTAAASGVPRHQPSPPRWLRWFGEATSSSVREPSPDPRPFGATAPEGVARTDVGSEGVAVIARRPSGVTESDDQHGEVVRDAADIVVGDQSKGTAERDRGAVRRSARQ